MQQDDLENYREVLNDKKLPIIKEIIAYTDEHHIFGIKTVYKDGKVLCDRTVGWGGNDNVVEHKFELKEEEFIYDMYGYFDSLCRALCFYTSEGREFDIRGE